MPFKFRLMNVIAVLKQGDSFGELALMYNKARFATVETYTDTHFVVLSKEDYQRVIQEADEKKMSEEIKFMRQFSILGQMTKISLHKLYFSMKIMRFKRD